jgi:Tfp pilus assembly protein PilF
VFGVSTLGVESHYYVMKTKMNALLSLTALLCISGCCCGRGPQAQQAGSPETTHHQNAATKMTSTESDLASQKVQTARKEYQEGRLNSAHKLLQAAIQIEPRNQEAWFYLEAIS